MAPSEEIIIYQYAFSPFARKVTSYMNLRNIPHSTVEQPPLLPRPDISSYGLHYRRIPVMSIGRDFYCDTPLILAKLDELFPASAAHPALSAPAGGQQKALEDLLQRWNGDAMFPRWVKLIPSDFGPMTDPSFLKDRKEIWGDNWEEGKQDALRVDGLLEVHDALTFLDNVVADGRAFAHGEQVSTADIHALFLFDWLLESVPGSIPDAMLQAHPQSAAWRDRYNKATAAAKSAAAPPDIEHSAARARILAAGFGEPEGDVDASDAAALFYKLKKGSRVKFYPTDNGPGGMKYQDKGELVRLTPFEAALVTETEDGAAEVRVHIPRWNFKVEPMEGQANGA